MPNKKGHFTLVSDSSGVACGVALYQEQKGKLTLLDTTQRNYLQQQLGTVLVNLNYVDWQSIYIVSSAY